MYICVYIYIYVCVYIYIYILCMYPYVYMYLASGPAVIEPSSTPVLVGGIPTPLKKYKSQSGLFFPTEWTI